MKPRDDTLVQLNGQKEPEPEDAWLNDGGPLSRPRAYTESNNEETSPSQETPPSQLETQSETYTLIDYTELLAQQDTPTLTKQTPPFVGAPPPSAGARFIEPGGGGSIGPGHQLWPVMLHLSERIWQEIHQKQNVVHVPEPAMIGFVRSRSLDLLRTEPALASQVRNLVEAEQLLHSVVEEVLGYGPLEALLKDENISEITVVGPRLTYVVGNGKLQEVPDCFEDEPHMLRIIENMLRRAGQRIEPNWPLANVRLPGGASVNIVMPPHAIHGPTITIRKCSKRLLHIADLVQLGSLTQEMANFLTACVQARLNIVICGGIGSGRTTLLNALGSCIPTEERIVTIEDFAELQLGQRHVVALESRLTDPDSVRRVTMHDLVVQALRMRPEHIIVGECHGSEVIELLQAMSTGCSGVLTTLYANNLRDCLTRLEVMCLLGGMNLPISTIRAQVAGALDVIVYQSRLRDGSHKVMNIAEVQGVEDDTIRLQSIFHYEDTEVDAETGKIQGIFRPGGFRPNFMPKIEAANIHLPREMFVSLPVGQLKG